VYLLPRFCSELRDFTCDVALVYLLLQERVLAPDSGPFFENKGPESSEERAREFRRGVCVYYSSTYYKAVRPPVNNTAGPVTKLFALGEGDSGGPHMCYERRQAETCVD